MVKKIIIIQGHPDISAERFCRALADHYAKGAAEGEVVARADHLVVIYPLWLGDVPALLKAFFEQLFRPGFAFKSAGYGLPALFYTLYFRGYGLKNLKRNILAFCGFSPIKTDIVGMVEDQNGAARAKWLERMQEYGKQGA